MTSPAALAPQAPLSAATQKGAQAPSSDSRPSPPPAPLISSDSPSTDWLAEYPPPRSLPLDQEALRVYELAYAIGIRTEPESGEPPQIPPPITFSTVLMALLVSRDDTSSWFADLATTNGPDADKVFSEKRITRAEVASLVLPHGKPEPIRLSKDKHLLTQSARAVLSNAEAWAQRVGGNDIGVRHLVAAYVVNPLPAHSRQMQDWGYQGTRWRAPFFERMAERYTAERWTDTQYRVAPSRGYADFEAAAVKGEALAFPGDADTIAILEHAAVLHARTRFPFLRFRVLFCALVERAHGDAALRATIQPIVDALDHAGDRYTRAYDAIFTASSSDAGSPPFSALDISPRTQTLLETARDLALATRQDADGHLEVSALQLAGALASRRVGGDPDLALFGLDPEALRGALVEHAQARGESADTWREALGVEATTRIGRTVELNSDDPEAAVRMDKTWTSDPLSIRRDVDTFAALLASQSLEPPLSIGLFGPWGSGKTTFLKRLRQAIDDRAESARKAVARGESTPYVGEVVHVEFNAWHYSEGALVSSLVDTIFRELDSYIKNEVKLGGKEWREQKLAALVRNRRQLEAAEALEHAAAAAMVTAEQSLAESRAKAAKAVARLQSFVQGVWSAAKAALQSDADIQKSGVLKAAGDTVSSIEDLRARLNAMRARPARLVGDLGWVRSLLFAALVLAVPPAVAWIITVLLPGQQAVPFLSSVTAALSVIGVWARSATSAVARVDAAIAKVSDEYERRIRTDEDVIAAGAALETAQAKVTTATAGVQAAREALARAQTDAANAAIPAEMLRLVSGRIDAQTYNKELTTLSLARADLQALSQLLREQHDDGSQLGAPPAEGNGATSPATRAVERIVLYIDDLDRCQPKDVVRVLQLVHMVLAFELFAVVVAVDARWVEESLRRSYQWLGKDIPAFETARVSGIDHDGPRVTAQDYLEKIFQISFWLEPMTSGRARSYLGTLVPRPVRDEADILGTVIRPESDGTPVQIMGVELDFMRLLAAYVGPSPRRVKRLVNAYRLIKAGLSTGQLAAFITRSGSNRKTREGPYQIVIGLLVIGTGAPASSASILKALAEWNPAASWDSIIGSFRQRNQPDWTMAAQVLEQLMRTQRPSDVSELRGWAQHVGRFLLNGPAAARLVPGVDGTSMTMSVQTLASPQAQSSPH